MKDDSDSSTVDVEATRLAADIDRQGYGVICNYVTGTELEAVRARAVAALKAAGCEYVGFNGADAAFAGTILAELPRSEAFKKLCRRLYERGTGKTAPDVSFYQVCRCLTGKAGRKHSYAFHYDSYALTVVLPVQIPTEGPRGDLLVFPNVRSMRRLYLTNLLDKVLIENRVSQAVLLFAFRKGWWKGAAVRLRPGDMYFFWGNRSLHTNEPCDPDALRVTAVFHYGKEYENNPLRLRLENMRRWGRRPLTSASSPALRP